MYRRKGDTCGYLFSPFMFCFLLIVGEKGAHVNNVHFIQLASNKNVFIDVKAKIDF